MLIQSHVVSRIQTNNNVLFNAVMNILNMIIQELCLLK